MIELPITMMEETYISHVEMDEGMCFECGEIQSCCEPDTRCDVCDSCEEPGVMAIEQMLMEGYIEFVEMETPE